MHGILFDMDGVLYNSDQPVAGAAETVRHVRQLAIPHLFVTNTTSRDRAALVEKLRGFGIDASQQEILTPAAAVAEWLRHSCDGPVALFLRPATKREFAGLPCLDDGADHGAAYVVIGDLGTLWDYRTLNRAFRLLYNNREAKLIALGMTRYWLATDGAGRSAVCRGAAARHGSGAGRLRQAGGALFPGRCRAPRTGAGRRPDDRRRYRGGYRRCAGRGTQRSARQNW